ncbi:MAG: ABC transporter ATP-binding protein [Actinomycetota bacterium]|nr:ABC transporter ATP-binding protein [Actinomycetota bacterium]
MVDVESEATAGAPQGVQSPAIRLRDLRKAYGDVEAVAGANLEIRRGEFFTLLGPSGSGKTTLLRLIAGFERPDSGTIELGGRDVTHMPPFARTVNTVFQDYALFPHMSVSDNIEYGLRIRKVPKPEREKKAREALEVVRLTGLGERKPQQLSGGQRQRVALARAIVNRPEVLLLDEPLGALDLKLRQEMQSELKRIERQLEITFLYVTHDQEEALTMSDRIAVLDRGRIEQVGTPVEVYERPASDFVAGFIGISNVIERDGRHITVRPEKIRILDAEAVTRDDQHVEAGVISEVVYVGMVTRFRVVLDAGGELVVAVQNYDAPAEQERRIGERVRVAWRASHGIAVGQE